MEPPKILFENFRRTCGFFLEPEECDAPKPPELEAHMIDCNVDRCPILGTLVRISERNKQA